LASVEHVSIEVAVSYDPHFFPLPEIIIRAPENWTTNES